MTMDISRRSLNSGLLSAVGLVSLWRVSRPGIALGAAHGHVLTAREGVAQLVPAPAPPTRIWGIDGGAPGPTLLLPLGEEVNLQLVNALPEPTSLHWHGMRVPNAMDGVSGMTQDAVEPGESFDYRFTVRDSGTYWYHAHNRSWVQNAMGVHGMIIVPEADPPQVDQDIGLVLDDWRLDQDGQIDHASFGALADWAHAGRLGNWPTANGVRLPSLPVRAGERLRLRLLNVANARILTLAFPGHAPQVVALDGVPVMPHAVPATGLVLAPGQRADVIVDMDQSPGTRATIDLVSAGEPVPMANLDYAEEGPLRDNSLDAPFALPFADRFADPSFDTAVSAPLDVAGGAMGRLAGATVDGQYMSMREMAGVGRLWAINGVAGRPDEPLVRVESGRSVRLDLFNDNSWPHVMHLHGHHMQAFRGAPDVTAAEPWRDGVLVQPGERMTIGFVADAPGKWLLHCHMLEHQAAGMATWIEVV